jgi:hypothetical protein
MKDDKKKVLVVGILFAVLAGVGAFTFLGGSAPKPVVAAKKDPSKSAATKEDPATKVDEKGNVVEKTDDPQAATNPLYAAELPQRDPFETRAPAGADPYAMTKTTPPPANPLPPANSGRHSSGRRSSGGGSIPPMQPLPLSGALGNAQIGVSPTGPDPSAFGYQVSGVIVGNRPAAVFTDSGGNQRLVPVGGSLDGDSKVISIDKGQVTVEHRGKKLRLPLGGNPQ